MPETVFDQDALRRKCREERDKRLPADSNDQYNDQYLRLEGRLAYRLADAHTPITPHGPRTDPVSFAFIRGGFAGLVTAARLVEAGIGDVRIGATAGGFGGTWYWNRYPGGQRDTAPRLYGPRLEETGRRPSEKCAHAPEILAHCERNGRQYGLCENALFHTEETDRPWGGVHAVWRIRTNRGDAFTAQCIGLGTGPLHVPKLPGIPGIETFGGPSFHTSCRDCGYTGGDALGAPRAQLANQRAALIGSPDCTPVCYDNAGQDPGLRARLDVGCPAEPAPASVIGTTGGARAASTGRRSAPADQPAGLSCR